MDLPICVVSYYKLVKDLVEKISKNSSSSTRFILLIFSTRYFNSNIKYVFSKNKKNVKILRFFLSLFLIFAQNLLWSHLTSTHILCFRPKVRKIYPAYPRFTI